MVDESHTPALRYVQIVNRLNAATLLPIIQAHIVPGIVVHSDESTAYNRVATLPNSNVASHSMPQSIIRLLLLNRLQEHTLRTLNHIGAELRPSLRE